MATNFGVGGYGLGGVQGVTRGGQAAALTERLQAGGFGQGLGSGVNIFGQRAGSQQEAQALLGARAQDFAEDQFAAQQRNRQQLLDLIGFTPETVGPGGLLGNELFQSTFNNTLGGVVGDVTGNIPGLGSPGFAESAPGGESLGGGLGQPGFADAPGAPGTPGGGGAPTSLFDSLLQARGQFGSSIMDQINQFGQSQRSRINQDFQNVGNSALANLESRGLGGSSLALPAQLAVEGGRQQELLGLEDSLIGQRVDALQGIGEGLFGDIDAELNRQLASRGQGLDFVSGVLGNALNIV